MIVRRGMRTALAVATVIASAGALSGCGGEASAPSYAPQAARRLQADVADIRAAAQQRRIQAARAAVHRLTRHVADAQAAGELPSRRARGILAAADAVTEDLAALPARPAREKAGRPPGPRRQEPRVAQRDHRHGAGHGTPGRHHGGNGGEEED